MTKLLPAYTNCLFNSPYSLLIVLLRILDFFTLQYLKKKLSIRICSEYFQAESYKFLKNIEAHEKLWYSYKKRVCSQGNKSNEIKVVLASASSSFNFEHISHIFFSVSIGTFEQVNASSEICKKQFRNPLYVITWIT